MIRKYTPYGNNHVEIWENGHSVAVIPRKNKGVITKSLGGGPIPKKYRRIGYETWMTSLNNYAHRYGRFICRGKSTWQAFCKGTTPLEFWTNTRTT